MKSPIKALVSRMSASSSTTTATLAQVKEAGDVSRLLLGRLLANHVCEHGVYRDLQDSEFRVFSQFGDDGILQYLIHQTEPPVKEFIEFGVQGYSEANTRFLLLNNNWRGLIVDADPANIEIVRKDPAFWRHDLHALAAFVTRDNVNTLFEQAGFEGEIGLLSVDIDGNDYWVWGAIDVVQPVIVTMEYNSVFGAESAITIPYDPAFSRTRAHFSNLYWGASLPALCRLGEMKGYSFVGCNSNGNNAHFVRRDRVGKIPIRGVKEGYVESRFRESRDESGKLTYVSGRTRIEAIKDMQVVDLERNALVYIRDMFGLG
jgi:hypothetical protein